MTHHLFCLTIDADPDGLSAQRINRRALVWDGLEYVQQHLPPLLSEDRPVTWFVRADGQLREVFGSSLYLLEKYHQFWAQVQQWEHEIGWHPHLYRYSDLEAEPVLITDPVTSCDELERLGEDLKTTRFEFRSFRNGEAWHTPQTFAAIEQMGFCCDSTAIPGRDDPPRDWRITPNQPYFPATDDIRTPGKPRSLLEIPINSWSVQANYDEQPKFRYMNPAIREDLFAQALDGWEQVVRNLPDRLCVWTLIFHPDEVMPIERPDRLYAHSIPALVRNLTAIIRRVTQLQHTTEFVTLSDAACRWKLGQS